VSADSPEEPGDGRLAARQAMQQAKEEWALRLGMVFGAPLGAIGYSIAGWLAVGMGCAVVLLTATALFLVKAIIISNQQTREADNNDAGGSSRLSLACRLGRHRWTLIPADVQERANKAGVQGRPPNWYAGRLGPKRCWRCGTVAPGNPGRDMNAAQRESEQRAR